MEFWLHHQEFHHIMAVSFKQEQDSVVLAKILHEEIMLICQDWALERNHYSHELMLQL